MLILKNLTRVRGVNVKWSAPYLLDVTAVDSVFLHFFSFSGICCIHFRGPGWLNELGSCRAWVAQ